MNKNETFLFPKELSNTWHVTDIIYFSKDYTVCRVQNINSRLDYIMKVYSFRCFSKRKFEAVSNLTDRYFITPKTRLSIRHTEYIFFPAVETLKDILYHSGMSFHDILCLGINLIEAVQILSRNGIYEADISPNNIYRNAKGSFCLGDLPLEKSPIFGTPPFIAPEYMDIKFSRSSSTAASSTDTFTPVPFPSVPGNRIPDKSSLKPLCSIRSAACSSHSVNFKNISVSKKYRIYSPRAQATLRQTVTHLWMN